MLIISFLTTHFYPNFTNSRRSWLLKIAEPGFAVGDGEVGQFAFVLDESHALDNEQQIGLLQQCQTATRTVVNMRF